MAKSKYVGHPPSLEAFRTPPLVRPSSLCVPLVFMLRAPVDSLAPASLPQLVLSNFNPAPGEAPKPQLKLMSTMFQGMFPPIQIDKVRAPALPPSRSVALKR